MNNNILSDESDKTNETNIDGISDALLDNVLPKKNYNEDLINDLNDLKCRQSILIDCTAIENEKFSDLKPSLDELQLKIDKIAEYTAKVYSIKESMRIIQVKTRTIMKKVNAIHSTKINLELSKEKEVDRSENLERHLTAKFEGNPSPS